MFGTRSIIPTCFARNVWERPAICGGMSVQRDAKCQESTHQLIHSFSIEMDTLKIEIT
jgi:hypothetical protein